MKKIEFVVAYDSENEELMIYQDETYPDKKIYDKIRTPGDIGQACKDYVMEVNK